MRRHSGICIAVLCFALSGITHAENNKPPAGAEKVVAEYFEHLKADDIASMDALFFRIPAIRQDNERWLELIEHVSQKVKNEQLAWEVVCGKELSETAVVIVNQTMKQGRPHGDPDAVFLVRENDRWLLLPDLIANNARKEVESAMSPSQITDRYLLRRWALGEIRGLTSECRPSQEAETKKEAPAK